MQKSQLDDKDYEDAAEFIAISDKGCGVKGKAEWLPAERSLKRTSLVSFLYTYFLTAVFIHRFEQKKKNAEKSAARTGCCRVWMCVIS